MKRVLAGIGALLAVLAVTACVPPSSQPPPPPPMEEETYGGLDTCPYDVTEVQEFEYATCRVVPPQRLDAIIVLRGEDAFLEVELCGRLGGAPVSGYQAEGPYETGDRLRCRTIDWRKLPFVSPRN